MISTAPRVETTVGRNPGSRAFQAKIRAAAATTARAAERTAHRRRWPARTEPADPSRSMKGPADSCSTDTTTAERISCSNLLASTKARRWSGWVFSHAHNARSSSSERLSSR
jgi:hypothetical protein